MTPSTGENLNVVNPPQIAFTVFGVSQPQGSKTAFVRNGRAILTDGRRKEARDAFAGWRASVATAASDWLAANGSPAPLDGPIMLTVRFFLPRPANAPKRVSYPTKRPDCDKLLRSVGDALSGLIYRDDSQIVELHVSKEFAIASPPRAEIEIGSMF